MLVLILTYMTFACTNLHEKIVNKYNEVFLLKGSLVPHPLASTIPSLVTRSANP